MTFGKWMRNERLDRDMTIRQFSQLIQLSTVTICKLEGDKYEPGRYALRKLGEGLGKTYIEMREILKTSM
jgi:transcriptional regulator with XRE-family HTH domain